MSIKMNMLIVFVENKTNRILPFKKNCHFPYIGETFSDEFFNVWRVMDISVDLLNGKMHIYIERESESK